MHSVRGQGANMTFEDAHALGLALAAKGVTPQAIRVFERTRIPRANMVQWESNTYYRWVRRRRPFAMHTQSSQKPVYSSLSFFSFVPLFTGVNSRRIPHILGHSNSLIVSLYPLCWAMLHCYVCYMILSALAPTNVPCLSLLTHSPILCPWGARRVTGGVANIRKEVHLRASPSLSYPLYSLI